MKSNLLNLPRKIPVWARIMQRIEEDSAGCWNWVGHKNIDGYGIISIKDRPKYAHRIAYEEFVGPVDDGKFIDHICRNRICVNPEHMESVTSRENTLRGVGITAMNAKKTHCPSGHEYSKKNTRRYGNERYCKECVRVNVRSYRARLKAKQEVLHGSF